MNEVIVHLPDGPETQIPERIIVHSMAKTIVDDKEYSAVAFLKHLGLSAHILISPNGEVMRCRDDEEGAWHARGFNTNSLGVEFLVKGKHDYWSFLKAIETDYLTNAQFNKGLDVIRNWYQLHDIKHLDRHSDVDSKRKKDPGKGFPWKQFRSEI